jgi:shikimate kinase
MGTPERRREAIFLAGMPGSGKTRVIEQRYGHRLVGMPGGSLTDAERAYRLWDSSEGSCRDGEARTAILDLDREMVEHPLYAPEDPAAVYNVEGAYDWADLRVEERFRKALADPSVGRVILDGTGTKVARRKGRMAAARAAGFRVKILYVRVTLETAKRRNLRRHRVVPLETLRRYEEQLTEAVRMSGVDADEVEILDNDVDVHVGDVDATP